MVLLTMTPAIVRALEVAEQTSREDFENLQQPSEPTLAAPKAGNPISHGQLIDLSTLLKRHALPTTLDALLHGSSVYMPPPPPAKPQTTEYKALMARLRAEEEARAYDRMLKPSLPSSNFTPRYDNAHSPSDFSIGVHSTPDDDELSYEEVHRQIILIINVLVSVIACAVFIWVAARHWSAPKRLGLSMGGSGAVAIAEIVVYSGYVRKVAEAKKLEKKKPEIKEIVQSWVIDGTGSDGKDKNFDIPSKNKSEDGVRYRKGKHR
jgi:hypothetical protein